MWWVLHPREPVDQHALGVSANSRPVQIQGCLFHLLAHVSVWGFLQEANWTPGQHSQPFRPGEELRWWSPPPTPARLGKGMGWWCLEESQPHKKRRGLSPSTLSAGSRFNRSSFSTSPCRDSRPVTTCRVEPSRSGRCHPTSCQDWQKRSWCAPFPHRELRVHWGGEAASQKTPGRLRPTYQVRSWRDPQDQPRSKRWLLGLTWRTSLCRFSSVWELNGWPRKLWIGILLRLSCLDTGWRNAKCLGAPKS